MRESEFQQLYGVCVEKFKDVILWVQLQMNYEPILLLCNTMNWLYNYGCIYTYNMRHYVCALLLGPLCSV
jgi:hypothetical protein